MKLDSFQVIPYYITYNNYCKHYLVHKDGSVPDMTLIMFRFINYSKCRQSSNGYNKTKPLYICKIKARIRKFKYN